MAPPPGQGERGQNKTSERWILKNARERDAMAAQRQHNISAIGMPLSAPEAESIAGDCKLRPFGFSTLGDF
jgi:hypothetical protein